MTTSSQTSSEGTKTVGVGYPIAGVLASPLGPIAGGMIAQFVLDLPYPSAEFALWMWGPFIFGLGMVFGIGLNERTKP